MKNRNTIQPPKLADRFFNWYCQNELGESILGDLHERYEDYLSKYSKTRSNYLYWVDIFRFINRHTLKRKSRSTNFFIPTSMFKNYALVALRNIRRNKTFTGINVIGLSISMAVCLLIITMINDQTSYDEFHSKRDEIYRVTHKRSGTKMNLPIATVPLPLAGELRNNYAGIQHLVRFRRGFSGEILDQGKAIAISGLFTDTELFDLFDFELEKGDKNTALNEPYSVILRSDIAEKFFRNNDPLGQILDVQGLGQFKVTGVLKEFSGKTHINFEALSSFSTVSSLEKKGTIKKALDRWEYTSGSWIYFNLNEGQSMQDLQIFMDKLEKANYNEDSEYLVDFDVQNLTNITPGPLMGNQIGQAMPNFFVYGLVVLAFLIMICAALNYANLTTARALTRFKEVGVRKVMGSTKSQVILQFVLEAVFVSLISLMLSILLLQLLIPAFEGLNLSSLLGWELMPTMEVYVQFFVFSLATGLLTGFFPSLYMSSVKAISALKGLETPKMSGIGLRKSLIVVQLVISIVLIISSTLVYKQIKFMIDQDYGYERESIINIDLQGQDFDLLRTELEKLSFVKQISGANNVPNIGRHDDVKIRKLISDEAEDYNYFSVDENYIDNLELQLIAGNNFTPAQTDEREVILNEQATKSLGFSDPELAIGENVILEDSTTVNVIGVVKDYNFQFLYMEIKPLLLRYKSDDFEWAQVKIAQVNTINELGQLDDVWAKFDTNHDFEYKFFDEQIQEFHSFLYDIVYIIGLISVLSIVIAGMGLLGIASYSIRTRLKEVGIRKILGASGKDLVFLLGKSFFIMILVSTLIGGTLAFFGNKFWLDLFAYRINFGMDILGIAFLFVTLIGALTIGIQAWKATVTNPSDVLRNE